jgi:hypothetical protein
MTAPDTISFDFVHVDHALKECWRVWAALQNEISAFAPRDLTQDPSFRSDLLAHFHALNPGSTDEDLETVVSWAMRTAGSVDRQFSREFDLRLMNAHITATLLSLCLSEALINSVLAVGLVTSARESEFADVEGMDVRTKWISGPNTFAPSYSLPKGTALAETLDQLVRRRNTLVHHKISVFRDGTKVLGGSEWNAYTYRDLVRWTERFFSLPYDLVDNALRCSEISAFGLILDRGPINRPDAHASGVNR